MTRELLRYNQRYHQSIVHEQPNLNEIPIHERSDRWPSFPEVSYKLPVTILMSVSVTVPSSISFQNLDKSDPKHLMHALEVWNYIIVVRHSIVTSNAGILVLDVVGDVHRAKMSLSVAVDIHDSSLVPHIGTQQRCHWPSNTVVGGYDLVVGVGDLCGCDRRRDNAPHILHRSMKSRMNRTPVVSVRGSTQSSRFSNDVDIDEVVNCVRRNRHALNSNDDELNLVVNSHITSDF